MIIHEPDYRTLAEIAWEAASTHPEKNRAAWFLLNWRSMTMPFLSHQAYEALRNAYLYCSDEREAV